MWTGTEVQDIMSLLTSDGIRCKGVVMLIERIYSSCVASHNECTVYQ